MANELTVVKKFEVAPIDSEVMAAFKEEMEGLGTMPIDTIKIPSGGGIAFEVPGEDPDSPDMAKELIGVITGHKPQNAYWQDAYSGDNASPDCYSDDGKVGINTNTGESRLCETCPFNQFGSALNAQGQPTKGKACKNLHRLYLLMEGALMPVIINIPPTSIKPFKDYLAKRLLLRGKRPVQVLTKITLKKAVSNDGITYSQCVFTKAGDLAPDIIKTLAPVVAMTKDLMAMKQTAPAGEVSESNGAGSTGFENDGRAAFDGKVVNGMAIPEFEEVAD